MKDRAIGCLLGLAVGDAVGTTLEFRARDSYPPLTDMIGGGPFDLKPGEWTDDTSMALALGDSLLDRNALDAEDLMRRFVRWWREGAYSVTGACFDIGVTTRAALARFEASGDAIAGATDPPSAGNGSLMRLAPIAIRFAGQPMRDAARSQSATTHGARACRDACEGYALVLRAAIEGMDDPLEAGAGVDAEEPIATILRGGWRGKPRDGIGSTGWVAHSQEAVLWCVAGTTSFRDAVLLAANLGDDADTTAAITGQLASAVYGAEGVPREWRARVAWRERIETMAVGLWERGG